MFRRWLLYLLVIIFLWVFISQLNEIQKLALTLIKGQWQFVLIAAVLQVAYYGVFAWMYSAAFSTVEINLGIRSLLPAIFASMFVNVAAPSGGTSGMALLVGETSRQGQSPARSAAGVLLAHAIDFITFFLVLLGGLTALTLYHELKLYEVAASLILVGVIGVMAGLLVLGIFRPDRLDRLLSWFESAVTSITAHFHLRSPIQAGWDEKNSAEFNEAALAIATHPDRLGRAFLLGLAGHIVDLASLYALFLAFHEHIGPGILVAGFAMGILFWVVSITPQGIGVVEGMMTLTFISLGIPAEPATVISLSFRFLTFWIPFFAGFLILPRLQTFRPARTASTGQGSVRMISLLTAVMGIINLISAVTISMPARLQILSRYSPMEVRRGSHLAAALMGFSLLLLASGLWRRKRMAWLLTLAALLVTIVSHLLKGLDYEVAGLAILIGMWLIYLRPEFHARSDTPSIRQGLIILAASFGFTLLYGTVGFFLLDRHFKVSFGLWPALRQTVVMFTQFYDPGLQPLTGFGRYFASSIYAVGAITFLYSLWLLARPVFIRQPASHAERERAREIVERYGRTALARLTLLPDKQFFFSPGGSVVSFVVKGGVAVTLGDPIGPENDLDEAISLFHKLCLLNDWRPAFYQVLPDKLLSYKQIGMTAICIGQEAIVNLCDFTLEGRGNKGLRSGYNKMIRLGMQAKFISAPADDAILAEAQEVSDEWLAMMKGTEKKFSIGWFDLEYLRSTPLAIIVDLQGNMIAFANILPEYAKKEATIDLMRHRRDIENGVMDFLFTSLILWARQQGLETFSLGLSSLAGTGEKIDDPAVERALHYFYEHVNRFYNFKGLHEFKDKFQPDWQPRYLIYPNTSSLPAVVLTLIRIDSGDDWLGGYLRR